ncbi:MAG: 50S ribosomal protein L19 [Mycoplasmoidaceae bacterium]|nr:50S ribosomal protein L19 [Mycoplasmoidaceae bacterium]
MANINKQAILSKIVKGQMRDDIPNFKAGDTISVSYKIIEGKKARIQTFTGVCLRIKGSTNSRTFILRKENGVEKTFPMHSPQIVKVNVDKKGKVRRAYISYMRQRSGKSARIAENKK